MPLNSDKKSLSFGENKCFYKILQFESVIFSRISILKRSLFYFLLILLKKHRLYLVLKSLDFLYTLEQIQNATNAMIMCKSLTLESIVFFSFSLIQNNERKPCAIDLYGNKVNLLI